MALVQGTKIGPYEIVAPVGAGGMGEVYRARDARLNRDVAVKTLPASLAADREHLARFTREAEAASALNHPNILTVFDVGTFEGAPYLVAELLQGDTLRARLATGPLPPSKAIDVARQVAAGLAAAHEKGIIHRDIKPANLFVTTDGRVKILDFGLARQLVSAETDVTRPQSLTEAGVVMGTLGYMSPEQVRGQKADARTDIFSLGVVLYEMLTGKRAFSGPSSVETMHAILQADPPDLSSLVPPGLGRIVARCLEKDPAGRFHSAHDLGLALELVGSGSGPAATQSVTASAPRASVGMRLLPWLAVAIGAGALGAFIESRRHPASVSSLTTMESLTYSGHDASPAASPDGKTVAFTSDRDGVPRIWLKQVAGGGELALTSGSDDYPRFSPDGASIIFVRTSPTGTALYRVPLLGGDARKILDNVSGADWSPDGRQIAFTRWVSGDRSGSVVGLAEANGAGERELALIAGRALVTPRWSPDGRTIAAVNGESSVATAFGVNLVDVSGGGVRLLASPGKMRQSSVLWSPDSRSVIYSEAESIVAWNSGSAARIISQDVSTSAERVLCWMPNHSRTIDALGSGRLLLDTRSSRENLREVPIATAVPARWLTHGNSTDRQPTYSPDGQWVAFSSNRSGNLELWAVNRSDGTVRRLTDDPADDWDPAYSHDGRRLLWGSNRSGPYEIWAANPDGSSPRQLTHDGYFAQNPGQTADGQWIAYIQTNPATTGLWKVRSDGKDPVRIVKGVIQISDVSPDGKYVLFVDGLASKIRVVRTEDGEPAPFDIAVSARKATTAVMGRSRWMPDGRAIAFIAQDEQGVNGVFVQDFVPGRDTTATRRKLGGFDPENSAESLGVSPDGKFLTVASWEQMFGIMIVNGVTGIRQP